jgi:hypothetical protein
MYTNTHRNHNPAGFLQRVTVRRSVVFGVLIITALLAFEVFNYSTTEFALKDLLGNLRFAGLRWATILAIAFCGIDFAGIARLFTPETGVSEPAEVWYLFGAWLLAATMNAILTWWGVSIALLNHQTLGNAVISQHTLLKVVPVFVALMVWLIRVLIIGTFSVAGERLFNNIPATAERSRPQAMSLPARSFTDHRTYTERPAPAGLNSSYRPAPKPASEPTQDHPEPIYTPVGMSGRSSGSNTQTRQ